MNGFVIVDMNTGHCLASMPLAPNFGLHRPHGASSDSTQEGASLSAMCFGITLNAFAAANIETESVVPRARDALQRWTSSSVSRSDFDSPNVAPIGNYNTEQRSLHFYLTATLPFLVVVSSISNCPFSATRKAKRRLS